MDKTVFTNGCFDVLHPGHLDLLERARALGTRLVVGINGDASVRAIKGVGRPILGEEARRAMLLGLRSVNEVIIYSELTPERLISEIKPDVLVKGGDWPISEIIGADFVLANGGEVHSLPLVDGFSSSGMIGKMHAVDSVRSEDTTNGHGSTETSLNEHLHVIGQVLENQATAIRSCADMITETFQNGKKVLLCGNGGSAADAQHIAAEFVGRYEAERVALPAIALTTDTSALTAITNDYDFTQVFARQVKALAREGDCLIAISTSGNSPNVIAAVMEARALGCRIIGLTGAGGKKLAGLSDACIAVPSSRTARVQEAHITIAHIWCEIVESQFLGT